MKERIELLMALFFMFFWVVKKKSLCAVFFDLFEAAVKFDAKDTACRYISDRSVA